jgi:hypothetical protein
MKAETPDLVLCNWIALRDSITHSSIAKTLGLEHENNRRIEYVICSPIHRTSDARLQNNQLVVALLRNRCNVIERPH